MKAFLVGLVVAVVAAVGTAWLYEILDVEAETYFQGRAANLVLDDDEPAPE
ncbi:MAG: hypothetical protein R3349_07385 [Geminicoccaceae bacterium]|nr:hypothetical protein [Geminicoccaceae bacterium]